MNANDSIWEEFGDLGRFLRTMWESRWLIVSITSAATALGILYALSATAWYRAEVVLAAPANGSQLPSSLSQFGGLANLAGINLGSTGDQQSVAVLKSKEFAREFIAEYKLVEILNSNESFWPALPSLTPSSKDIRDSVRIFDEQIRTVTENRKAGLVTLSIRWKDPEIAAKWANLLVVRLNERMRRQAEFEAMRNVNYLQREIARTSVVSLQESLGRVLEVEMQKLLLARGNEEFAFKVIDKAVPPTLREWPKRTLITMIAAAAGLALSVMLVLGRRLLYRRSLSKNRESQ